MAAKQCTVCGETTLVEKTGEYRMDLPPSIPGGCVVVSNTNWLHCESCSEDILSPELERAINVDCRQRRVARVG